uniref:Chloride channel accessory 4 n=1 Tax=Propithecus coquereli TaxID=379532 RepID=A0A2K6FA41_PROCO
MVLLRGFIFLLILYLPHKSNTSFVRLNGNGYEDVIIAIDPGVPEDEKIIEQIKDMVTTASTYLFEATEQRLFFKNVSILIPENWGENSQYKRPKHENYKHADVIVAPPTLSGGDEPYTRQFTECEEKGEYIHFTPDVVLGKKQNEYGPTGRLFVHEWTHLRWGVFDEYNEDQPFYSSTSKKIEATRCTSGISGTNSVYTCQGGSCYTRTCRTNSTTKLYEKDCQFFPNKVQTEKASIMFMQSIDSVSEFCNEKNHNQEAPSLQNIKCNFRSIWEVISNSEDFKNTTPLVAPPSPPAFSLLQISQRTVCLVLDKSGSMGNYDRLNRMNQAAKYFLLQVIENESWVGMVHFSSTASVESQLIQITNSSQRNKLVESLPTASGGGTSICSGITKAFEVIKNRFTQLDGSEIVLLTDGEDSSAGSCTDEVGQSGAIIHFIALGESADTAVIEMSDITGGSHYYASDEAQNNGLIDAFGDLTSGNADLFQKSIQKVGIWTYSLQAKQDPETLTITVTSRAANSSVPPITVNAKMNKETNSFPSPMIVYVEVLQGYVPVLGANVIAFIESQSGNTAVLELLDNGAGEIEANPPRSEIDENTQTSLENFSRTASGGAFVVSQVPGLPLPDLYPPSQITDLEATPHGDEITLTWTAPGDDFDVGKVQYYIVRISGSMLDLRDNFDDALQVNTSDLVPHEANFKETFSFKPGHISEENITHIFIAIKSVDKSNLTSKISNIAQVALFIPEADPSPDENYPNPNPDPDKNHHNSGVNISVLVLSVAGSVIVVTIIVSITIC